MADACVYRDCVEVMAGPSRIKKCGIVIGSYPNLHIGHSVASIASGPETQGRRSVSCTCGQGGVPFRRKPSDIGHRRGDNAFPAKRLT